MSHETILSIVIGAFISVPIGIIGGLYAGLLVARYQRFADLRLKARRVVQELGFIQEGNRIEIRGPRETPELGFIASELLFLQHREAAEVLLKLGPEIYSTLMDAEMNRITLADLYEKYDDWQDATIGISPNRWQILKIWAGL